MFHKKTTQKAMENAPYFADKAPFVLKIFKLLYFHVTHFFTLLDIAEFCKLEFKNKNSLIASELKKVWYGNWVIDKVLYKEDFRRKICSRCAPETSPRPLFNFDE